MGECLGLPPGQVGELLWHSGFSASCDAGRYRDAAAIRAQIRRITGYAGSDEHLDTAWCSAFRPDPDVVELLARHPGGRRGVFTNNGPLEEEVLTRLYPDVFGPFEHLFFCWRLTDNKPDPAVYRQVTDLLGVPPGQISFADDSADNVEAALARGWNAVRYRSPGDLGALTGDLRPTYATATAVAVTHRNVPWLRNSRSAVRRGSHMGPGWLGAAQIRAMCRIGPLPLEPHRRDPRRGQDLAAAAGRPARPLRKRAA